MKTAIKLVLIYFLMQIRRSTVCRTFLSAVYVFRLWNFRHGQGWSDCCGAYHAAGLCFHGTVLVAQELPDGRQASVFSGVSPLSGMEPACRNDFHMYNRSSDVHLLFTNLLDQTFDIPQSGWLGILCISVLGPVLEELLFRGAITKELLRRYSPAKAILFSGLIFGIFHPNPVQIIGACLIGFLLAWLYYKTRSLMACILIHIMNNGLSVYLSRNILKWRM